MGGSTVRERAVIGRESRPKVKPTDLVAKARARSAIDRESSPGHEAEAGKG
jgi:hypothetical protein